jgi:hypothetical protein
MREIALLAICRYFQTPRTNASRNIAPAASRTAFASASSAKRSDPSQAVVRRVGRSSALS